MNDPDNGRESRMVYFIIALAMLVSAAFITYALFKS